MNLSDRSNIFCLLKASTTTNRYCVTEIHLMTKSRWRGCCVSKMWMNFPSTEQVLRKMYSWRMHDWLTDHFIKQVNLTRFHLIHDNIIAKDQSDLRFYLATSALKYSHKFRQDDYFVRVTLTWYVPCAFLAILPVDLEVRALWPYPASTASSELSYTRLLICRCHSLDSLGSTIDRIAQISAEMYVML